MTDTAPERAADRATVTATPPAPRLTVAFDVDDVCVRLLPAWLRRINAAAGTSLAPEDITTWDFAHLIPEEHRASYHALLDHTVYEEVEPDPVALALVKHVRAAGHRVVFVTSAMSHHAGAKLGVLRRHGFLACDGYTSADYVEATDKALIRADVLIDDRPANVEAFAAAGGVGVLWHQPHNADHSLRGHLLDRPDDDTVTSGTWYAENDDYCAYATSAAGFDNLVNLLAKRRARKAGVGHAAPDECWVITDAGRAALAAAEGTAPDEPTETVLEEAQRLVHGDRAAAYGHPYDDYTRTSRMWEALLDLPDGYIGPRTAAQMMILVKQSRERHLHKRDNLTDTAGYAACAMMIAEREAEIARELEASRPAAAPFHPARMARDIRAGLGLDAYDMEDAA